MFPQLTKVEVNDDMRDEALPFSPTDMLMLLLGYLVSKEGGTAVIKREEFLAYVGTVPEIMIGPGPDAYVMITSAPGAKDDDTLVS